MAYLRTTRPATSIIYSKNDKFPIGGSKVLKKDKDDRAVVIAAGITIHEALKAYEELKAEGILIRIIDAYSVEPLDKENISQEAKEVGGKVVVVEDHFQHGGLGEAVALALAGKAEIINLAVKELPRSGTPEQLMEKYGINARHIKKAVKSLVAG